VFSPVEWFFLFGVRAGLDFLPSVARVFPPSQPNMVPRPHFAFWVLDVVSMISEIA